jgi:hypothetical protein
LDVAWCCSTTWFEALQRSGSDFSFSTLPVAASASHRVLGVV